jgi:hypothetical protein
VGLRGALSRIPHCEAVALGVRAGLTSQTAAWPLVLPVKLGVRAGLKSTRAGCCRPEAVSLGVRAGLLSQTVPCCHNVAVSLGVLAGLRSMRVPCCFWEDSALGVKAGLQTKTEYAPPAGCGMCPCPADVAVLCGAFRPGAPPCLAGLVLTFRTVGPATWRSQPFLVCTMTGANQMQASCLDGAWTLQASTACFPPSCCFSVGDPTLPAAGVVVGCTPLTVDFTFNVDASCGGPASVTLRLVESGSGMCP